MDRIEQNGRGERAWRLRKIAIAIACSAVLGVGLAACGGSDSKSSSSPAASGGAATTTAGSSGGASGSGSSGGGYGY
jgi:hypothetical protein